MATQLKRLIGKLNEPTMRGLESAAGMCLARTHYEVDVEHWLMQLLRSSSLDITRICIQSGVDIDRLQRDVEGVLAHFKTGNGKTPAFAPALPHLIEQAWLVASIDYGVGRIRSGHVVIAALEQPAVQDRLAKGSRQWALLDSRLIRERFEAYVAGSVEVDERFEQAPPATAGGQPRVFICYRREDWTSAGRIYDYMARQFGPENVFRDFDTLGLGEDWPTAIDQRLTSCNAVIALVSKLWSSRAGLQLFQQPDDYVRYELALAVTRNIPVIPLFLGDKARMPRTDDLPDVLHPFTRRQGVQVLDSNFEEVMSKVTEKLRRERGAARA
jgi:hypothetical protein